MEVTFIKRMARHQNPSTVCKEFLHKKENKIITQISRSNFQFAENTGCKGITQQVHSKTWKKINKFPSTKKLQWGIWWAQWVE